MIMHQHQRVILERYKKLCRGKTLREMSQETGIQLSRLFRLFNGSQLRWDEYLKFRALIAGYEGNVIPEATFKHIMEQFMVLAHKSDQEEILERIRLISRMRQLNISIPDGASS